jgi:hypothetical protein
MALDEKKDFLETLLILKLRLIGIQIDYTSSSTPNLRQAMDSFITAVDNSTLGEIGKDIDWSTFNTLFDTFIVRNASFTDRLSELDGEVIVSFLPRSEGEAIQSKHPHSEIMMVLIC